MYHLASFDNGDLTTAQRILHAMKGLGKAAELVQVVKGMEKAMAKSAAGASDDIAKAATQKSSSAADDFAEAAAKSSDDVAKKSSDDVVLNSSTPGADVRPMSIVREIKKGEKIQDIIDELRKLTYMDTVEHAVVTLKDGTRVIVSGGEHGISLSDDVKRVIGHTHPHHHQKLGPSQGDKDALKQLGNTDKGGQRSSYLIEGGQDPVKFKQN